LDSLLLSNLVLLTASLRVVASVSAFVLVVYKEKAISRLLLELE
jgi:hypothetical protein